MPPIPPSQHAQGSEVDQCAMGAEQQPAATPPKSSVKAEIRRIEGRTAEVATSSRYVGVLGGAEIESSAERTSNAQSHERRPDDMLRNQAGAAAASWPQTAVYRAGKVPNFAALHALWAQKLAAAKAAVHQRLTVPKVCASSKFSFL